jgi:hypothetical protein
MDHSVGGRATIWRELRVKFGSDFGDVQPHMIGGGSLSQEVGHLSQQIGSASKIPVNFWVHFSLTRFQTSKRLHLGKNLSAARGVSTSAWDVNANMSANSQDPGRPIDAYLSLGAWLLVIFRFRTRDIICA